MFFVFTDDDAATTVVLLIRWYDSKLCPSGIEEAIAGGKLIKESVRNAAISDHSENNYLF